MAARIHDRGWRAAGRRAAIHDEHARIVGEAAEIAGLPRGRFAGADVFHISRHGVAVTGAPNASQSDRATAWPGTRIAIERRPAWASGAIPAGASKMSDSGPGQKRAANRASVEPNRPQSVSTCRVEAATSGRAARASRPFRANRRRTAAADAGSTANP